MAIHHPKGNRNPDDVITGQAMRKVMIEVVEEYNKRGPGYSRGTNARRAPLSMATWSGSETDRRDLMFP